MKRTDPSPNAKHVHIGVHYVPPRFERRLSDGTYQALMPEHRAPHPHHSSIANGVAWAVAVLAAASALAIVTGFAR